MDRYRLFSPLHRVLGAAGLEDHPGVHRVPGLVIFRFQPDLPLVEKGPAHNDVPEIPAHQHVAAPLVKGLLQGDGPAPGHAGGGLFPVQSPAAHLALQLPVKALDHLAAAHPHPLAPAGEEFLPRGGELAVQGVHGVPLGEADPVDVPGQQAGADRVVGDGVFHRSPSRFPGSPRQGRGRARRHNPPR